MAGSSVFSPRRRRNAVSDKVGRKVPVIVTHGAGWPDKAIGCRGPDAKQDPSLFEGRENDALYMEEFRRVADLNKEFADNLGNYGAVVVGRTRVFTFGESGWRED